MHQQLYLLLIAAALFSCKASKKNSKQAPAADVNYNEQHRPQYHFSPKEKWMNDPNGLVYLDGEYHLFYQYYPDSTVWGPMHWGHAISADMVHWQHLPVALYPDSLGYIFSGSVVADTANTSGLGVDGKTPLVAIFTHHNMQGEQSGRADFQTQSIAYSADKGRTWVKYKNNPVIPNPGIKDFRDPKVFWYAAQRKWVLTLAAYDKVMLYASPDLKNWNYLSSFGIPGDKRLWECPDLFPIKTTTGEEKWVLITSIQKEAPNGGTATGYFVGHFNGTTFTADNKKQRWLDYGTDNYAMVTWWGIPPTDGRTLALGWMSNWQYAQQVPTKKWRSAMTLPRSLSLHHISGEYELFSRPVKELAALEEQSTGIKPQIITTPLVLASDSTRHLYKIECRFEKPVTGFVQFRLKNAAGEYIDIGYRAAGTQYYINREHSGNTGFYKGFAREIIAPAADTAGTIGFELYLDRSSAELFTENGRRVITAIFFPSTPYTKIELTASTPTRLLNGTVTTLKRIWK